jgi:hypothetical protein
MNPNTTEGELVGRGKLRRFGLFLGSAIALYVFAVMLFIIAY